MGSFFPREKTHGETFLTEEGDGVLDAGGGRTWRRDGRVESDPVRPFRATTDKDKRSAGATSSDVSIATATAARNGKGHALVSVPGRFPSRLSLLRFFE